MKKIVILILQITIAFQFCIAQNLDCDRVWDSIKTEVLKEYCNQYRELYKDDATKNVKFRIDGFDKQGLNQSTIKDHWRPQFDKIKFNNKNFDNLVQNRLKYFDKIDEANDHIRKYVDGLENQYLKGLTESDAVVSKEDYEKLPKDTSDLNSKIKELKSELNTKEQEIEDLRQDNSKWLANNWHWMSALVVILILLWVVVRLKIGLNNSRKRRAELKHNYAKLESEYNELRAQKSNTQKEEPRITKVESKTILVSKPQEKDPEPVKEFRTTKPVVKYLCCLTGDGTFGRVDDVFDEYDSCYRIINLESDDDVKSAKDFKFEFYSTDHSRAIANWSSMLRPASDYDGNREIAKSVSNLEPGIVRYDSANECWKIIKKAKLKLS